jgi:hypothetical protein
MALLVPLVPEAAPPPSREKGFPDASTTRIAASICRLSKYTLRGSLSIHVLPSSADPAGSCVCMSSPG